MKDKLIKKIQDLATRRETLIAEANAAAGAIQAYQEMLKEITDQEETAAKLAEEVNLIEQEQLAREYRDTVRASLPKSE
jgi:hypothetical protein